MVKLNPERPRLFFPAEGQPFQQGIRRMDAETESLIQRWIIAFCETPVLVDAELMRMVLADVEATPKEPRT